LPADFVVEAGLRWAEITPCMVQLHVVDEPELVRRPGHPVLNQTEDPPEAAVRAAIVQEQQ